MHFDAGMPDEKQYVLVVMPKRLAFGPFETAADAEYAAMDFYGTAITGASARNEFLIAELRSDAAPNGAWNS